MISYIIQVLSFIKIHPNTSQQEKKQQRISDLPYAKTKPNIFPK